MKKPSVSICDSEIPKPSSQCPTLYRTLPERSLGHQHQRNELISDVLSWHNFSDKSVQLLANNEGTSFQICNEAHLVSKAAPQTRLFGTRKPQLEHSNLTVGFCVLCGGAWLCTKSSPRKPCRMWIDGAVSN